MAPPAPGQAVDPELQLAKPKPTAIPARDMPWKKKPATPPATDDKTVRPQGSNE
jgi:hypothetical protein